MNYVILHKAWHKTHFYSHDNTIIISSFTVILLNVFCSLIDTLRATHFHVALLCLMWPYNKIKWNICFFLAMPKHIHCNFLLLGDTQRPLTTVKVMVDTVGTPWKHIYKIYYFNMWYHPLIILLLFFVLHIATTSI